MSKPFPPKVVTANALLKGDVVYLTANDDWSPNLSDAEVIEDEAHACTSARRFAPVAPRTSFTANRPTAPEPPAPQPFPRVPPRNSQRDRHVPLR
jgi:hypothetical protein